MDSDHQLEFQTQVCIYPVPGKLRTLPPASFLASSPALPVQTCCDPVTPLPPSAGVLCPITFLHSRGGRLWPPPLCGIVTHHHTGISTSMPLFQRHPPPKVSTLPQSWLTVFWPCKDHLHSCLQQVAV